MAFDKVVDSVKLDASLSAEADAIRAKIGSSEQIPFDLENNKGFADAISDILKGSYNINVSLDGSDNQVLAITDATGGVLPTSISKIDGGSFTPTADISSEAHHIMHNLGTTPKGCIVWTDDMNATEIPPTYRYAYRALHIHDEVENENGVANYGYFQVWYRVNGTGKLSSASGVYKPDSAPMLSDYVNSTFFCFHRNADYYKQGCTYHWLAWA